MYIFPTDPTCPMDLEASALKLFQCSEIVPVLYMLNYKDGSSNLTDKSPR